MTLVKLGLPNGMTSDVLGTAAEITIIINLPTGFVEDISTIGIVKLYRIDRSEDVGLIQWVRIACLTRGAFVLGLP